MKYILITVFSALFLCGICSAGEDPDLRNEKNRVSYSVGYQVGGDFKRQGMDIRPETLIQGVRDALAGKEPVMSREEMRATLADLQKEVLDKQKQKEKEQADLSLDEGLKTHSTGSK